MFRKLFINMYADDTVMYFTNICTSEIARVVQDDLNGWKVAGLSLIRVKQKSMLFAWSCMAESCQITKFLFTVIQIRL